MKDFLNPLAIYFDLSDEEVSEMYESGNGYIFYNKISWTLRYLNMAGLLNKPKRGVYKRRYIRSLQDE